MENCIFCQISKKELPAKLLHEDDDVLAFPDINPVKPVHIIIVPRVHIAEVTAAQDPEIFKKLFEVVQEMIAKHELQGKGYRVVINGGGAQLIDHLHIHVMGPISKTAIL